MFIITQKNMFLAQSNALLTVSVTLSKRTGGIFCCREPNSRAWFQLLWPDRTEMYGSVASFSAGVVLIRMFRAMKFQSHMHFTDSSELLCYNPVALQLLTYSGRKQNQQKKIHPPQQIVRFAHSRFRELSKFSVLLTYSLQCLLINAELFHQIANS